MAAFGDIVEMWEETVKKVNAILSEVADWQPVNNENDKVDEGGEEGFYEQVIQVVVINENGEEVIQQVVDEDGEEAVADEDGEEKVVNFADGTA